MRRVNGLRVGALVAIFMQGSLLLAQEPTGPGFSYQGSLSAANQPVSGPADLLFKLYDSHTEGTLIGTPILKRVDIHNGVFSTLLNDRNEFGAQAFNGQRRWIEVAVNGVPLHPRQELTRTPYASFSQTTRGIEVDALGNLSVGGSLTVLACNTTVASCPGTGTVVGQNSSAVSGSAGVFGESTATTFLNPTYGVFGKNTQNGGFGAGVFGLSTVNNDGVRGESQGGGAGVRGIGRSGTGNPFSYGVLGVSFSDFGIGVVGEATSTANSGGAVGGWFSSWHPLGMALIAEHGAAPGFGTYPPGTAVVAHTASTSGRGVYGVAGAPTGVTYGGYFLSESNNSSAIGAFGRCDAGVGVYGKGGETGVFGTAYNGVVGLSPVFNGNGLIGTADLGTDAWGVSGQSIQGQGVVGRAGPGPLPGGGFPGATGVVGYSSAAGGIGVFGQSPIATANSSWAGYFDGRVNITGSLCAATLCASAKAFRIDHPLDPEHQYLLHTSVESPDMKNMYDGVAVLDEDGKCEIDLPDWFQALNCDFRYQLTCIGAWSPVFVAKEIHNNRFQIDGGKPGMKVSWQVTGIRHDAWAQENRTPVEVAKSARNDAKYSITPN